MNLNIAFLGGTLDRSAAVAPVSAPSGDSQRNVNDTWIKFYSESQLQTPSTPSSASYLVIIIIIVVVVIAISIIIITYPIQFYSHIYIRRHSQ